MKIAIFGATSHIAKGLINNFLKSREFSLHLYTTSPEKASSFLDSIEKAPGIDFVIHEGYKNFMKSSYDVIINCVGVGTMAKLRGNYTNWFMVTEKYDNLAIEYLLINRPDALYISLSSGTVYGRDFSAPMKENTRHCIDVNHIVLEDYYPIVRLNAEAKHRAFGNLRIIDLRLFAYFSRFIDFADGYFITELLDCILKKKIFITGNINFVRDYVHPEDLFSIIGKCIDTEKINEAFDVTSSEPVEKQGILDYFSSEYGLKYEISQSLNYVSATGPKSVYYSEYNNASKIGYKPVFSSMDTIKEESKYIINQ
ncbi:NAD-dependent epimerase/dehydratase family protein [Chloroflexota bacterium]